MKKKIIIKESKEFTSIINKKKKLKNNYYSIFYLENEFEYNRYGISIPKKTGTAVVRNKIKRQIKSIIDNNEKHIKKSYNYVIIVKKEIIDLNYKDKEKYLLNLLKR